MSNNQLIARATMASDPEQVRIINAIAANRATVHDLNRFQQLAYADQQFVQLVADWKTVHELGAGATEWGVNRARRLEIALGIIWCHCGSPSPLYGPLLEGDLLPSHTRYDQRHDPELRALLQNLKVLHPTKVIRGPRLAARAPQPNGGADGKGEGRAGKGKGRLGTADCGTATSAEGTSPKTKCPHGDPGKGRRPSVDIKSNADGSSRGSSPGTSSSVGSSKVEQTDTVAKVPSIGKKGSVK